MKNGVLLFGVLIIAIVIMTLYDFQLRPGTAAPVPPGAEAYALYVCPIESAFDSGAVTWQRMEQGVNIALLSFLMLTLMVYRWITYVALVKDKVGHA